MEELRQKNIERNQAYLAALGFLPPNDDNEDFADEGKRESEYSIYPTRADFNLKKFREISLRYPCRDR